MFINWCADCKTPGCKRRQVFKQAEFAAGASDDPTMQLGFPSKFEMRCKTCGTVHNYTMADVADFQSKELRELGFESRF